MSYGYDHTAAHVFKDNCDALIATIEDTGSSVTTYFNHLDHLNSTSVVTDDTGYTSQLLAYYAFGECGLMTGMVHELGFIVNLGA
jgi:hypothetical protein